MYFDHQVIARTNSGDQPASLLKISGLSVEFAVDGRVHKAVDGVDLTIQGGESVCIVGESGCGKSVTAMSILRLIDPPGRISGGEIEFRQRPLLKLNEAAMRKVRGREIGMIFQEPMTSLNPVLTIHEQLSEGLAPERRSGQRALLANLLETVGLDASVLDAYPHRLSGGQRQRVMIAMALVNDPALLIADEPTTALDVSVQAQILELLKKLIRERRMALLLITHDFGVVNEIADRVLVMYAGRVVEEGTRRELLDNSAHPYTRGLLRSIPRLDGPIGNLPTIEGVVPDSSSYPSGCRFHPRCDFATDRCRTEMPVFFEIGPSHRTACWEHASVRRQG